MDKRNKALITYEYSLVQFHNIWTKEILNIGVILNDKSSYYIHIPKIYDKIQTCLDFTELAGLKYTLEIIEDRIKNQQRVTYGEVSNSIFITEQKSIKSELSAEDALHETVQKLMMIKKFRHVETSVIADKYDKLSILKLITQRAKAKNIENYMQHKQFKITKKLIDMALVDKDKNPYSIANMASIYKDNFDDALITSVFTLQDAMRSKHIQDQFLYIPIMENRLTSKQKKSVDWAKEQARYLKIDMLTDKNQDAVLERLGQYKLPKDKMPVMELLS